MKELTRLHIENCTFQNAMLFGIAKSHFNQVCLHTNKSKQITHLVLGILEAIPVIGQIISFIEFKIVSLINLKCRLPKPSASQVDERIEQVKSKTLDNDEKVLIADNQVTHKTELNNCSTNVFEGASHPLEVKSKLPVVKEEIKEIEQRRPEPLSCILDLITIKNQETPQDICRIWPVDLKLIGLTEFQKDTLDTQLRDAFRGLSKGGTLRFDKKKLTYTHEDQLVNASLPISICIFEDKEKGEGHRILLFPKTVFATGGERKIRWVYDLTNGNLLLKKRVTGAFEEKILNYLSPLRAQRGIHHSLIWRTSKTKNGQEKRQMIETVREGTIEILFGKAPLASFSVKKDLVIDLLMDLMALHSGKLSDVKLKSKWPQKGVSDLQSFSYNCFHADIKTENILVFYRGKWRAELCDFGGAASHPTAFVVSCGYTPPEYIAFYKRHRPFGIEEDLMGDPIEIAEFNTVHGKTRDVWALGLVIATLLVERREIASWENPFDQPKIKENKNHIQNFNKQAKIPPFSSLKRSLSGYIWSYYDEVNLLTLKQKDIDADLEMLEKEVASKHLDDKAEVSLIFKMLKENMLRIDSSQRKPISECLAMLMP